jgi:hypothetical protein
MEFGKGELASILWDMFHVKLPAFIRRAENHHSAAATARLKNFSII